MAASSALASVSKAEYLKRYLSGDGDGKTSKNKKAKKKRPQSTAKGMRIVDDDVDWKQLIKSEEKDDYEEEEEAPVVAEVIDERPEEVKRLEEFRNSKRWKTLGGTNEDFQDSDKFQGVRSSASSGAASQKRIEETSRKGRHDSPDFSSVKRSRHDSPDLSPQQKGRHDSPDLSPQQKGRHDSPDLSPQQKGRHDSPDLSPQRKGRHDSPDLSPQRKGRHDSPDLSPQWKGRHDSPDLSPQRKRRHHSPDLSPQRKGRHDSPDLSPQRKRRHHSPDLSPSRQKTVPRRARHYSSSPSPPVRSHGGSPARTHKKKDKDSSPPRSKSKSAPSTRRAKDSDSDLSPPRRAARRSPDSDLSPPRRRGRGSDSDLSPPRRRPQGGRGSDSDLSPPRRASRHSPSSQRMLSGGAAGLVSLDLLRKEREENRQRDRANQPLEEESRNAETVFRDKSGKRRDIAHEREEQRQKAGEKEEKDRKYAQWGKGLVQAELQKRRVEDALREAQKPLARHVDDADLDRLLREQEREGDPMAGFLRRKKEKELQRMGVKEKPRYKGPLPPPNRFNIMPGYRWDGVDRSNGFEQKRFSRIADKKAVQEMAYKWSVEDM
ncbi:BUD13 homolog [Lepisosteus oculatus]|uniref:BUD13 homolog n=1 Tax=Lepisosteus oculatus TaxID=7918 RepID=UPI0037203522